MAPVIESLTLVFSNRASAELCEAVLTGLDYWSRLKEVRCMCWFVCSVNGCATNVDCVSLAAGTASMK